MCRGAKRDASVGTEVGDVTPGRPSRSRVNAATRGGANASDAAANGAWSFSHSRSPHDGFWYLLPGTSLWFGW